MIPPKLKLDESSGELVSVGQATRLTGLEAERFHVQTVISRMERGLSRAQLVQLHQSRDYQVMQTLLRKIEATQTHFARIEAEFIRTRARPRPRIPPILRRARGRIPRAGMRVAGTAGTVIFLAWLTKQVMDRVLATAVTAAPPLRPPPPTRALVAEAFGDAGRRSLQLGGLEMVRQMANAASVSPPVPHLSVNTAGFKKQLDLFSMLIARDFAGILRAQTSFVINRCINLTPPFSGARQTRMQAGRGGGDTYTGTARKRGETRVRLDIRKVFMPVNELTKFRKQKEFAKAVRRADAGKIKEILGPKFNFRKIAAQPDPALHALARDRQGRVRRKRPDQQLVLKSQSLARYIKERQARVGMAKSGWRTAVTTFGLPESRSLPNWVSKHNGEGTARDGTRTSNNPKVMKTTWSNDVPWLQTKGRQLRIIEYAMQGQAKALRSNLSRIMNERGKKVTL